MSKGVGLIVKNNIARHIYRHGNFKGRIIFIDLIFKNAKKLRIIQYYGIVKRGLQENKQEFIETINKLMEYIQDALATQHELIVMGDFNQKYEKYMENKNKSNRNKIHNNIFYALEERYNLYDPHRIMYDITLNNPIYTWTNGIQQSRIDYIWTTENIMMNYENANITDISQNFRTDHKMLSFSFWTEDLCSTHLVFDHKQDKIEKIIYKYEEMNEKEWENYQQIQKDYLTNENFDQCDIEKHWDVIKKGIYKSNEIIKKDKRKINLKSRNPNQQTESYQG
jgi:exonuclease III